MHAYAHMHDSSMIRNSPSTSVLPRGKITAPVLRGRPANQAKSIGMLCAQLTVRLETRGAVGGKGPKMATQTQTMASLVQNILNPIQCMRDDRLHHVTVLQATNEISVHAVGGDTTKHTIVSAQSGTVWSKPGNLLIRLLHVTVLPCATRNQLGI